MVIGQSLDWADSWFDFHFKFFDFTTKQFGGMSSIFWRISSSFRHLTGLEPFLQIGQFSNFGIQVLQVTCPFKHWYIGPDLIDSIGRGYKSLVWCINWPLDSARVQNVILFTFLTMQIIKMGTTAIRIPTRSAEF